tara:strand:+ start:5994 stop:7058 length:1065 start_codon:yes stop_codon:yes gene_type:complete
MPSLLLHGLDSLYVCYYFDLATSKLDFDELEYRKQLAKDRDTAGAQIEIGGERLQVMPYGKYPYGYVLANRNFVISMAEHMHPTVKVQFYSEALWRDGARALHERIEKLGEAIKATAIKSEQVIRADWAFDFDLSVIDFNEEHFVSRARKNSKWRDGQILQTITFGVGDTVIRLYDKVAEIENASDKSWFYDLWGQKENVWRVEFQIRGERLKQASIKTLQDLEDLQGDLLRELSLGHTTLRTPNGDSNRARWPLHPLWRALGLAVEAMPQLGICRHYDPANPLEYRHRKVCQGVYGYLKSVGALSHLTNPKRGIPSLEEVLEELGDAFSSFHSESIWQGDIEERLRKYEAGQW